MNARVKPDQSPPSDEERQMAAESRRLLSPRASSGNLRVTLDDGTAMTLPRPAVEMLEYILSELSSGNAVSVIPAQTQLTTQEAAGFLNVSRPFLVKLLDTGEIRHEKVGTHRRVALTDLIAYKKRQQADSEKALEELARQAQARDMGY